MLLRSLRVGGLLLCLLASATAAAGKSKAEKSAELLKQAEQLLNRGRASKAIKSFEKAWLLASDPCSRCLDGWVRSGLQSGSYAAAAHAVRELTDLARQDEEQAVIVQPMLEALVAEYRQQYSGGEPNPDLLWGLFDLLAALDRGAEIFELSRRFLADADDALRSVLCAVDHRASLSSGQSALPVADKLNTQLLQIGWKGPYLIAGEVTPPRKRLAGYREGGAESVRMMGVINKRGNVENVRLVERPPVKRLGNARAALNGSFFSPAHLDGSRVTVCQPFQVAYAARPGAKKKSQGTTQTTSSSLIGGEQLDLDLPGDTELSRRIAKLSDLESLLDLLATEKLAQSEFLQRGAICATDQAIYSEDLNDRLLEIAWPGPFLLAGKISRPEKLSAPQPQYDEESREQRVSGAVVVQAMVDAQGGTHVLSVLESPNAALARQAIEAIERWSFRPARLAGRDMPICYRLTVNFGVQ